MSQENESKNAKRLEYEGPVENNGDGWLKKPAGEWVYEGPEDFAMLWGDHALPPDRRGGWSPSHFNNSASGASPAAAENPSELQPSSPKNKG